MNTDIVVPGLILPAGVKTARERLLDPERMPERIRNRPRDHRGYPYLFMLGEEQFKGIETDRLVACIRSKLCGICGEQLEYWMTFVGGPMSCENRVFTDPPFHPECAQYAMTVCPYILAGSYDRSKTARITDALIADPHASGAKVDRMGMYLTRSYRIEFAHGGTAALFVPAKAKEITWIEFDH